MLLQELFNQGIRKVRLPIWNKFAYLELTQTPEGGMSLTGKLFDIGCHDHELPLEYCQSDQYEAWPEVQGYSSEYLLDVYNIKPMRRWES